MVVIGLLLTDLLYFKIKLKVAAYFKPLISAILDKKLNNLELVLLEGRNLVKINLRAVIVSPLFKTAGGDFEPGLYTGCFLNVVSRFI